MGVSLFAGYASDNGDGSTTNTVAEFDINGAKQDKDHTIDVYTSADGSAGAKVSIHKALVFSALTFNSETLLGQDYYQVDNSAGTGSESDPINFSLAADENDKVINLNDVSVNVFLNALENIAALRAQNGSTMSRLEFQEVNLSRQRSNMEAAVGRITDVDMGAETTRMAKVQCSKAGIRRDVGSGQSIARSGNDADPINAHGEFIGFICTYNLERILGDA